MQKSLTIRFGQTALAENSTGGTHDINSLKKSFFQISNSYAGITGDTSLNEAGDRKHGDYDFWAIRANNGNSNGNDRSVFAWKQVGRFQSNPTISIDSTNPNHTTKTAIVTHR